MGSPLDHAIYDDAGPAPLPAATKAGPCPACTVGRCERCTGVGCYRCRRPDHGTLRR